MFTKEELKIIKSSLELINNLPVGSESLEGYYNMQSNEIDDIIRSILTKIKLGE
jgi:hypothetical protein